MQKPNNPNFSSGPCAKRPNYSVASLKSITLGRSHRSGPSKNLLKFVLDRTKSLLKLPENYRIGIVPASDTGAFEMAIWNLLGQKVIDVFHWESFGSGWYSDIVSQLRLQNVNNYMADYGQLPDMRCANPDNDCVFTWNGTTSGVCLPNADWISDNRSGLTLCDATSAVFAVELPWEKLDVTTFSWQKALGGEGAHGMLILSPRAVERLENWTPPWPVPKIFRLTKNHKLIEGIFNGVTINTPSMLCVEDYNDALQWVESIGGLEACIKRTQANFNIIEAFVQQHNWIDFLAQDKSSISKTSVCLSLQLSASKIKQLVSKLEQQQIAYDIGSYRDAPAGIRIWCGTTVETDDIQRLLPWIEYYYQQLVNK